MGIDASHLMTPELREAKDAAKRGHRRERDGASEYGPGPSRNRADVAPLVNRAHRDFYRSPEALGPHATEDA